jgi:uncharacterized phiE125 gp8 family phage protein
MLKLKANKMSLVEVPTENSDEIMTLEQAKAHLRVDYNDDDTLIEQLISVSRTIVEDVTYLSLVAKSWRLNVAANLRLVKLPRPPIVNILQVNFISNDGIATLLNSSNYWLEVDAGCVHFLDSHIVPPDAKYLSINYNAGYEANKIPTPLIQAAKLMLGHFYDNRNLMIDGRVQNISQELPVAAHNLMERYSMRDYVTGCTESA